MSESTPLEPPSLGAPIGTRSRQSSEDDRTAVPTPVDSGSIRGESSGSQTSDRQASGGDLKKPAHESKGNTEEINKEKGSIEEKKDEWTYEKQLRVSLESHSTPLTFTDESVGGSATLEG